MFGNVNGFGIVRARSLLSACPYHKVTSRKLRLSTTANCRRECYSTMKWLIIRLMQPTENRIICRTAKAAKRGGLRIFPSLSLTRAHTHTHGPRTREGNGTASRENGCIFGSRTFGRACGKRKRDRDSHSPSAVLNLRANLHAKPASPRSEVEDYYE